MILSSLSAIRVFPAVPKTPDLEIYVKHQQEPVKCYCGNCPVSAGLISWWMSISLEFSVSGFNGRDSARSIVGTVPGKMP